MAKKYNEVMSYKFFFVIYLIFASLTNDFFFISSYAEKYSNIYIKNYNKHLPDKFILLCNHDYKESDLYTIFYFINKFLSTHKIKIIVGRGFAKTIYFFKLLGINPDFFHVIDNNINNFYINMNYFVKNNDKCCIIIFPEGSITRYSIPKNINPNTTKCDNFNVIENNCFIYKKGAFVLNYLLGIHVVQSVLYNSCPNFIYTYFGKKYYIKHINHRGMIIFKYNKLNKKKIHETKITNEFVDRIIFKKKNKIEKKRLKFQNKFINKYIKVILNSHKHNL